VWPAAIPLQESTLLTCGIVGQPVNFFTPSRMLLSARTLREPYLRPGARHNTQGVKGYACIVLLVVLLHSAQQQTYG
jgi:hypothetical protein